MRFWIDNGDVNHAHWFLWVECDTELEAIAANRAIDEGCKHLGRFQQIFRSDKCSHFCDDHFRCPGIYGWEMWSLRSDYAEGEQILNILLPAIKNDAYERLVGQ